MAGHELKMLWWERDCEKRKRNIVERLYKLWICNEHFNSRSNEEFEMCKLDELASKFIMCEDEE